jgi:hypothetical protein
MKANSLSGAFDDLDRPMAEFAKGVMQDAVGEQIAQPGKQLMDGVDEQHRPIAILDIGGVHLDTDQQTAGVSHDVSLAPFDLLGGIVAPRPAALGRLDRSDGLALRPVASRACSSR